MLAKQFLGKRTWQILGGIVAIYLIAIFTRDTGFELPALILVLLATLAISWKSLPHGLIIAFAEVFVGGHGHLLDSDIFGFSVSIRMVIFVAVMLVWLIKWLKHDIKPQIIAIRDVPWVIIFVAVVVGTVIGFLNNNPANVFDDMNGFVVIAYLLPLISIQWTQTLRRELLQTLAASVIWLVFSSLLLSILFTHLDGKTLDPLYKFVRDSRIAEITLQTVSNSNGEVTNELGSKLLGDGGYWYRIFMPSQWFMVVMATLLVSAFLMLWRSQRVPELTALFFAVLIGAGITSMSRSFLIGFGLSSILLFFVGLKTGKKAVSNVARRTIYLSLLLVAGFGVVWASVAVAPNPDITDAAFYKTSADVGREAGVTSRWQLLTPMMEQISESPIIGSGFGTEVTYTTDDPRIRAQSESGEQTTYRFEWGYQDIWLKMGVLGILGFLLYLVSLIRVGLFSVNRHGHAWLVSGLVASVIGLFVVHIFSPYLNHPIGLITMLFVLPFLDFEGLTLKLAEIKSRSKKLKPIAEMSPAMSVDE
ncbi:MAG: O-antigen ligase family protein [Candidatus Uhrbacteria bacterium]|nr:O-antigen ligase family protein [Candidatus Uhrbacteria bacterium]